MPPHDNIFYEPPYFSFEKLLKFEIDIRSEISLTGYVCHPCLAEKLSGTYLK